MAEGGAGILARFVDADSVVNAARALLERGYRELDAFTPRPLPQLESLLAPERSRLPRSTFIGGVLGAATALVGQWYCNAWDYPLNVGGRPPFSVPAFIPITFELTVLFAALTTFFGVLWRMGLPRLVHPVFEAPGFRRATIDRYFLWVDESDPLFDLEHTVQQLQELGCEATERLPTGQA